MNAEEILSDPKRDENDEFTQEYDEDEDDNYEDEDSSEEEDDQDDGFKVKNDYYEEDYWSQDGNERKPEDMNGFNFKGTHKDWILNTDRVHKFINVKDRSVKIPVSGDENVRFKCIKTDVQNQSTHLLVQHPAVGKGEVAVQWWNKSRSTRRSKNKNKGCTIQVQKIKDGYPEHVLEMRKALIFLIDGKMNGKLNQKDLLSYIVKKKAKKNEKCNQCGENYKTTSDLKIHKCDVLSGKVICMECSVCHEKFTSENDLKEHQKSQHNFDDNSLMYDCQTCNKRFNSKESFASHNSNVHDIPPKKKVKETLDPKVVRFAADQNMIKVSGEGVSAPDPVPASVPTSSTPPVVTTSPPSPTFSTPPEPAVAPMDTSEIKDAAAVLKEATEAVNAAIAKMKLKEFHEKFFPQRVLLNVKGDGACVPRSISFGLFKDQVHYELIAKAMNKLNIQFFSQLQKPEEVEPGFFIKPIEVPVRVMVGGEEIDMTEQEYLNFARSEESIYQYRGITDMRLISGLLGIEMSVITVRRGLVISLEDVKPFPRTAHSTGTSSGNMDNRLILVLDVDAQHCQVLANAKLSENNEDLMEVLENYVSQNVPDNFEDRIASIQEKMRNFLPRMYKMEKENKNMNVKIEVVEEENKVQNQRIKTLEEESKIKDSKIEDLEKKVVSYEQRIESLEKLAFSFQRNKSQRNEPEEEGMSDAENVQQCQILQMQKEKGPQRQTPQFQPLEKKGPQFKCTPCGYHFWTEIELVKHRATLHSTTPDSVSRAVDEAKSFAEVVKENTPESPAAALKIPVVTSSGLAPRNDVQQSVNVMESVGKSGKVWESVGKRSYNCHECEFQGLNSKNLAKHIRETGHKKHDELKENCYSCGKTFPNFESLMLHRKEVHGQVINKCRYKDKNLCRFGDTCWYSHEDNEVQNVSNNQDFQDGQVTLPPEIKLMVSTMMEKAIEIWQQKGSREGSARSQGH